ncbi:unnamed protein product [Orchesella dallaii]|uniref:Uncharacterized protein n=1 Tax=Orchesella dallaii TaxID=48710 RepID=A0ABP1PLR8_9HEXA
MKIQTIFPAVALLATFLLFERTVASEVPVKHDISELTPVERILLLLTRPETYNAWFPRNCGKSKTPGIQVDYSQIDFLNVDLPSVLLQLSSFGEILLPTVQWAYEFELCYIGICAGSRTEVDYAKPEVRNGNFTSLKTNINDTNIEIEFLIPDIQLVSEKFTMLDMDLYSSERTLYRGLTFFISNYTMRLSANLEMVEDVGLQISNTLINFEVEDCRMRVENATHTLPDGTDEELGVGEIVYSDLMTEVWSEYQTDITNYIEAWMNCFLSNGRVGEMCDELIVDKLQTENFVQVLLTIGLGIAHQQEQMEIKSNAENKEKTSLLQLLLPEFPLPSIKSTILNLPTFLVQLGKILAEFQDPDYTTIENYLISYDFIRQNCSSGVCRSIQEQMLLAEYGIGGFSANRIQYDIQPTNFSFSLKVPSVSFGSVQFQHETTDLESGFKEIYVGANLTLVDCGFGISGQYELKEGVGLQVSDIGLTLRLGEWELLYPKYYTEVNGETTDHGELRMNIAPKIMEIWSEVDENGVSFERRYEEYIQNVINSYFNGEKSLY